MKNLLIALFACINAACFVFESAAQTQSYVTAYLTITNFVQSTNRDTISVNGHVRTWTNAVTSAATQLQQTNSITWTATNLWVAYADYPETTPLVNILMTSPTNIIMQGIPGQALIILTNGPAGSTNWLTWYYATNTITNAYAVRLPTNAIGGVELSNDLNGIINILNLNEATNAVNANLPQWQNFVNASALTALSNAMLQAGTNLTNFTLTIGANGTNYTQLILTNATNFAATLSTNNTNFTVAATNALYTLFSPLLGAIKPWQNSGDDVYLTNGSTQLRFWAQSNGNMYMYDNNQVQVYANDGTHSFITDNGGNSGARFESDYSGVSGGTSTGATILRSATGNLGFQIAGGSDAVLTYKPIAFQYAGGTPATCIGAFTNFYDQEQNSGSSATQVDAFTLPANVMTNNGDRLDRELFVSLASGATMRVEVIELGGGGDLIDTLAMTMLTTGFAKLNVTITRTGPSAYIATSSVLVTGSLTETNKLAVVPITTFNSGSGFAADSTFGVTLTGGSSGDLKILNDTIRFSPSGVWGYLP